MNDDTAVWDTWGHNPALQTRASAWCRNLIWLQRLDETDAMLSARAFADAQPTFDHPLNFSWPN
jgi:hypothetical protein